MKKLLRRLSRLEIVLIFLVIIAGSVVRMTGSGMGCPDWPKCFGYIIPPTERSTLEWSENRTFKKGNIIINNETLFRAKQDFTSSNTFLPQNWEAYTKHDYALFNPVHTWTEYINRLIGALSGIPMLLILVLSFFFFKEDKRLTLLALAALFMLGFEAWLGKLVVDGNLIPGSITIHMMGALLIVALLMVFNGILAKTQLNTVRVNPRLKMLFIASLFFTIIQIVLGTQVRETIDTLNHDGLNRNEWVENLDISFYIHRSFSILILALNFWLWNQNRIKNLGFWQMNFVLVLLVIEILLGVILAYLNLPLFAQPSHLLLGTIIFALQLQIIVHFAFKGEKLLTKN